MEHKRISNVRLKGVREPSRVAVPGGPGPLQAQGDLHAGEAQEEVRRPEEDPQAAERREAQPGGEEHDAVNRDRERERVCVLLRYIASQPISLE